MYLHWSGRKRCNCSTNEKVGIRIKGIDATYGSIRWYNFYLYTRHLLKLELFNLEYEKGAKINRCSNTHYWVAFCHVSCNLQERNNRSRRQ